MMDLEIRVAMAEILGAKWYLSGGDKVFLLLEKPANPLFTEIQKPETFEYDSIHYIKKYERDLNALHEIETALSCEDYGHYTNELARLCGGIRKTPHSAIQESVCASAKKRAQALLKILSKK